MTIKIKPVHIEWTLYLRSGSVELWKGIPAKGSWVQWECRNSASGETRQVNEKEAPFIFSQMLNNQES